VAKAHQKDILERLMAAELLYQEHRMKTAAAKKLFIECETDMVSSKITKENIQEELRIHMLKYPEEEATLNQLDIARFSEVLPGLLEKLKHE
jgi:hypothetical protein